MSDTKKSDTDADIGEVSTGNIEHSPNSVPQVPNHRPSKQVAHQLPTGEVPTSKNALRSFERSSYPQHITKSTETVKTVKPSLEVTEELINEAEEENVELSCNNPILEAIAAPVLEEADAVLFANDATVLLAEIPPTVVDVDEEDPPTDTNITQCRKKWNRICGGGILLVVVVVSSGVAISCGGGRCRRDATKLIENNRVNGGGDADKFSPTTPSPTNVPTAVNVTLAPKFVTTIIPTTVNDDGTTRRRAKLFIDFVNVISLAGRPIRNAVNGTPEDMALHWLISSDPYSRPSLLESARERFRIRQRYALSTLFFQQQQPPANNMVVTSWVNTSGWLVDVNECHWYGINCTEFDFGSIDADTDEIGPQQQLVVVGIYLQQLNIHGSLPSDLGLLSHMERFEIWDNALVGTIPESLEKWTNLQNFYIFKNTLTGTLPFLIGQWSNLQRISVTLNHLTGPLPLSIIQWTDLISFNVFNNQLNGTIPEGVGQWSNLDTMVIHHNLFSGTLPDTIGQWNVLRFVNITDNRFTGTIPNSIGQWSQMQTLSFRDNLLTGTLPSSIGSFTMMWYFDVAENYLTGAIPASIGNWSNNRLKYVAFDGNNLTGIVPIEFCDKNNETEFFAADCNDEVICKCCTKCY